MLINLGKELLTPTDLTLLIYSKPSDHCVCQDMQEVKGLDQSEASPGHQGKFRRLKGYFYPTCIPLKILICAHRT